MTAKELLPKLKYLILAGQNEDKELVWIGTEKQWQQALLEEKLTDINYGI